MTRKPGLVLVLCLVAVACAAPAVPVPTPTPTPVPVAEPPDKPDKTANEKSSPQPEVIKLPDKYRARENTSLVPPELPSTKQLMGLTRRRLVDILGLPSFRRRDVSAEIWQYRDDLCILDVFLYRQKDGESFRVKHIEARQRSVARVRLNDCYLGLLQKHSKKGDRPSETL